MKEKSILLGRARKDYLDFLRNLAPQAILFTFILIASTKFDFTTFDIGNLYNTFIFYMLVLAFLLAVYANCSIFFNATFLTEKYARWSKRINRLVNKKYTSKTKRFLKKIYIIIKNRKLMVIETMGVIVFFQLSLAIVIVVGVNSGTTILKLLEETS